MPGAQLLPAITRPNGRAYRPRMIDAKVYWSADEPAGIFVFGTHDVRAAEQLAAERLRTLNESRYRDAGLAEFRLTLGFPGRRTWIGLDQDAADPIRHRRRVYVVDEARGRAAVQFFLHEDRLLAVS